MFLFPSEARAESPLRGSGAVRFPDHYAPLWSLRVRMAPLSQDPGARGGHGVHPRLLRQFLATGGPRTGVFFICFVCLFYNELPKKHAEHRPKKRDWPAPPPLHCMRPLYGASARIYITCFPAGDSEGEGGGGEQALLRNFPRFPAIFCDFPRFSATFFSISAIFPRLSSWFFSPHLLRWLLVSTRRSVGWQCRFSYRCDRGENATPIYIDLSICRWPIADSLYSVPAQLFGSLNFNAE